VSGVGPFIGRLVDRFSARTVIIPSVLLFGLSVLSLSFLSAHLWHFFTIYVALGITCGGTAFVPYAKVVSRWFDRKRGLALGLSAAGTSLGGFITPSLAQALIAAVGWRQAYMLLGLMVIGIVIPVVGLFLKESPQMMGLSPDGETVAHAEAAKLRDQEEGLSCQEALRTGTFWLMAAAFFFISVSMHGCLLHLSPLLTDRGVSPQNAALAASLLGAGSVLGRIAAGYLLDRFFASSVAVCFFGGATLGVVMLWSGVTGSLAFVAAILLGMGFGAEGDLIAYTVSRYFGLRAFGEIYGYAFAVFTLAGVIGPPLMGMGFDATGSYRFVLGGFALATLTAAGLMTRLGPYRVWKAVAEPA